MVGGQTTAFVASCDTAESSPLTSFLNFLQSSEPAHPTDAGPTVTRLVHGPAAEPQRTSCCVEHLCCCRLIEIPDPLLRIPTLEPGQELVDPCMKPALVHEDRPHRRPLSWWTLQFRKLRSRKTNKGKMAPAVGQDPSFSMPEALTDACTSPKR